MYPKGNNEQGVIALYTGNYESRFYLREISRLAGISVKATLNALKSLERNKILKSAVHGKNKYFTLNFDNILTKFCLNQAELYKTALFLQKYPWFRPFVKGIETSAPIIVFGSFARFKAGKDSDVDILTISSKPLKLPSHLLPNKIHQINLTEEAFAESIEKQEALLKEIEASHIILNNHSFYVNLMWRYYGGK